VTKNPPKMSRIHVVRPNLAQLDRFLMMELTHPDSNSRFDIGVVVGDVPDWSWFYITDRF
jgi:hypothetical protein